MDSLLTPSSFVGLLLLMAGIVYAVAYHRERKRTEVLRQTARVLGLSFEETTTLDVSQRFGSLPLFSQGHFKRVTNLMSGKVEGAEVAIFG